MTTTPADERSAAGVEEDFCRCFCLQAMKLPRTRNRWTERLLIDGAFDAYLEWRDESAEVWHAYRGWNGAPAREARMPQQDDGIPVAEHPLERSAS
jgi:hypothetical protein